MDNYVRDQTTSKVCVIGVGCIGSTLAAHLRKSGNEVYLVDCPGNGNLQAIREEGLHITLRHNNTESDFHASFPSSHVLDTVDALPEGHYDFVFLCTKAPYLQNAVDGLPKWMDEKVSSFVSVQNGIGVEEILMSRFEVTRILRLVVNFSSKFLKNGHFAISPPLDGQYLYTGGVTALSSASGLICTAPDTWMTDLWRKCLVNCTMNALCALTRRNIGQALRVPESRKLVDRLYSEIGNVARRRGLNIEESSEEFRSRMEETVSGVYPSMVQDLERGLKSEIDYLNGRIVQYGRELNVDVTTNEVLVGLVKLAEGPISLVTSTVEF